MSTSRCTRFPNLNPTKSVPDDPASRPVVDLYANNDQLLHAWACLLSKYSGDTDEVSFLSIYGLTKVDLRNGQLKFLDNNRGDDEEESDEERPLSGSAGLYFRSVGAPNAISTFSY